MFPIRLGRLASLVGGRLLRGNPQIPVKHAVFDDARYLREGTVLFLKPRLIQAQRWKLRTKKSAGVIIRRGSTNRIPPPHAVIAVPDVNQAIRTFVRWLRSKSKAVFIGVTGSTGKTTTKEMITSVLMQKYRTLKSYDNNNVAQALPSNLVRLSPFHQVVVLEMGMACLGNIRKHCMLTKPSIGVVTNVGEAHVGSLGNSLENVVQAKQELVDGLRPGGVLILNADDPGSKRLNTARFRGKILRFGVKNPATVRGKDIQFTRDGMSFRVKGVSYQIPIWGKHNVYNALAAIAVAEHLGIPAPFVQKGLRNFSVPSMRLQRIKGIGNRLLINDTYNANPTAMIAGLSVLKNVAGKSHSVAVLGDMHDLGKFSLQGHRRVGKRVAKLNPSALITVGPRSVQIAKEAAAAGYHGNIRSLPNNPEVVAAYIQGNVPAGAILYFKASRRMALEKVVNKLRSR
ncbi:UDP-N-acetylmuramoyl-tripeptide--D-alanyl-D-alanine ligase [Desmospora profundinema]|uniref:UDP-N-acetylmuramoyl-tripeptide--D-alanyl-D-alanine ligase n=1 Tax=Desmospora profundinema TaxID=1571184 RepID=A0ABU1IKF9_9BACL|nr:UDP-N-acetylmuramoyl-tripeptide--D-alanyl-D-alanine ligase [Desmospora profundinema]MDR6225275.1 UDP-N-acetylmuramoyl-tripeptide--D-alanyl-D-alanine ligase [Desmospora profundinema]